MGIRIITDSSADFDRATAKRRQVEIISMAVQFGNASFLDGKTITNDVFYTLLKEGRENPTTSQPTPAEFLRVFEEAKAAGDQVVAVLISSVLSGTVQSAQIAKGMCEYEDIYIVDSLSATAGIQILVNLACKLRDSGLPAPGIAQELERLKGRIRIFAVLDTLEYLRRSGRLSGFQAGLGAMTKLKPVITVRDGAVSIAAKAFGTSAAVKQLQKFLLQYPVDDAYPSYFLYTDDKEREELLLPALREQGKLPLRLHYSSVGPTIGTHIGPGALGMAYIERE
ncbi:MAG: DegV family protein [Oscillospiraceae bacterium]|jgi:DegV family protein with EDD domain|nr:DegV family protein [Oscillospiraceae bacterium]